MSPIVAVSSLAGAPGMPTASATFTAADCVLAQYPLPGHGQSTAPTAMFVAATTAGNLLVATLVTAGSVTAAPSGWTLLSTRPTDGVLVIRMYYYQNAPSTSTVSFTLSAAYRWNLHLVEISGAATSGAYIHAYGTSGTSGATGAGPLTAAATHECLVGVIADQIDAVFNVPTNSFSLLSGTDNGANTASALVARTATTGGTAYSTAISGMGSVSLLAGFAAYGTVGTITTSPGSLAGSATLRPATATGGLTKTVTALAGAATLRPAAATVSIAKPVTALAGSSTLRPATATGTALKAPTAIAGAATLPAVSLSTAAVKPVTSLAGAATLSSATPSTVIAIINTPWDSVPTGSVTYPGWTLGSGLSIESSHYNTPPNGIGVPANQAGFRFATYGLQDGNAGTVTVSALFYLDNTQRDNAFGLAIRASASVITPAANFYAAEVQNNDWSSGQGDWRVTLYKQSFGSPVTIGSLLLSGLGSAGHIYGNWYLLELIAQGNNLGVRLQRLSDNRFLLPPGGWSIGTVTSNPFQNAVLTARDTYLIGSGYFGLYTWGSPGPKGSAVYSDNFRSNISLPPTSAAVVGPLATTGTLGTSRAVQTSLANTTALHGAATLATAAATGGLTKAVTALAGAATLRPATGHGNATIAVSSLVDTWIRGRDTFTAAAGTDLRLHTADLGGSWSRHPAYPGGAAVITPAARVRPSLSTPAVWLSATTFPYADYDVSADFTAVTMPAGVTLSAGIVSRSLTTDNYYVLWLNWLGGTATWQLCRIAAGMQVTLASSYVVTGITPGYTATATLRVAGNQISGLLNGVTRFGPVTDTNLTAAGAAGIRFTGLAAYDPVSGDNGGIHLDNWTVVGHGGVLSGATTSVYNPNGLVTATALHGSATIVRPGFEGAGEPYPSGYYHIQTSPICM